MDVAGVGADGVFEPVADVEAPNKNVDLDGSADGAVVDEALGALGLAACELLALLVDVADGAAIAAGLLSAVGCAIPVDGVLNNDGVDVEGGAANGDVLLASAARAACLSRILDMAAASKSCFSHFEYDFDFCSFGLSVAGEAGVW